jgi:hypothetical protein
MTETRLILMAVAVMVLNRSVSAQSLEPPPTSCWARAIKGPVIVTRNDGSTQNGTLVSEWLPAPPSLGPRSEG